MDDVGDVVVGQGMLEGFEVRDVPGDKGDAGQLIGSQDQVEPATVVPDIEGDDRHALAEQVADHPRADAAEGPGDQEALGPHATARAVEKRHESPASTTTVPSVAVRHEIKRTRAPVVQYSGRWTED